MLCPLQERLLISRSDAVQLLKQSIQAEHCGTEDPAKFAFAIGSAVIDLGLRQRVDGAGFRLEPVLLAPVGNLIAAVKKKSCLRNSSISSIIEVHLQQNFSVTADVVSNKHITMHLAKVLPQASSQIRALLPGVKWPASQQAAAAQLSQPTSRPSISGHVPGAKFEVSKLVHADKATLPLIVNDSNQDTVRPILQEAACADSNTAGTSNEVSSMVPAPDLHNCC